LKNAHRKKSLTLSRLISDRGAFKNHFDRYRSGSGISRGSAGRVDDGVRERRVLGEPWLSGGNICAEGRPRNGMLFRGQPRLLVPKRHGRERGGQGRRLGSRGY
jgi:hypothetical protein